MLREYLLILVLMQKLEKLKIKYQMLADLLLIMLLTEKLVILFLI